MFYKVWYNKKVMTYRPTIGLEIHAELKTNGKMFCGCLNDPDERHPNLNVCPICLGHPGTLPTINKKAVESVIKTGLATGCRIAGVSKFDRKNYFYPDLPKGYQISQYDKPLCLDGFLEISGDKIRVRRIHLEEDTGRLVHVQGGPSASSGQSASLIDFNRAGVPLMELVTEPDIKSAREARKFAEELQLILRYLGVSSADMEKGEMRCEANVSISEDAAKPGVKVEVKNLNSFKSVERAIEYELQRQAELLEAGEKIVQETRGWDENKEKTFSQRLKEEAHDYRYFPEPDLPPLNTSLFDLEKIKAEIPELPHYRRPRFKEEYKLSDEQVEILVSEKELGHYFEQVISELKEWDSSRHRAKLAPEHFDAIIKLTANYLISDLMSLLNESGDAAKDLLITPENFAEFVVMIHQGDISSKAAKIILKEMYGSGADPSHIMEEKGLSQLSDTGEIEKVVKEVIDLNPKAAADYRAGQKNAMQFLAGQIMAKTKGRANPQIVQEILSKLLTE